MVGDGTTLTPAELQALHQNADAASQLLKSLSHPGRLLLLCQLSLAEASVTDLEKKTGLHQPSLSQQLGILRQQGLIGSRRDGKHVFYRITDPKAKPLLETLYQLFCEESL